jgi:sulfate adenylyltransferase
MSRKIVSLYISNDTVLEVYNITTGAFSPLKGFMDSADYKNVVEKMRLSNGKPWTIPITLDVAEEKVNKLTKAEKIVLKDIKDTEIAELIIEDIYKVNFSNDIKKVFLTEDKSHPGIAKEISRSVYRVGGPIHILKKNYELLPAYSLSPQETKKKFTQKGWETITGFQTRNPIHRAHEYLQRIAMEITDGLFIQPLVGWKKSDDFSPEAIIKSYEKMIDKFYPKNKIVMGVLTTPMRYAGPREAIFHAIIRRNHGCTHFIVGRDHAGVGNYYGKYDAHNLCEKFPDLGIKIIKLAGPYYCKKCANIVTERTCPHSKIDTFAISGTFIRSLLSQGKIPAKEYMRKEIAQVLIDMRKKGKLFCH